MTTIDEGLAAAAATLASAQRVLITGGRRPDGDGCGAMVALASMLRAAGKQATIYAPDLVPRRYKWLPLADTAVKRLPGNARFDCTVVIDCADLALIESALPAADARGTLIDLDHHASGHPFGDVSVCDPSAASAGVLVARLAARLGWTLDAGAATGLYVSLVSDTGGFRHANANAEALRVASHLVERGASPSAIAARLEERTKAAKLRLIGAALSGLEVAARGRVAIVSVTHGMVEAAGASWDDSEGLVNWARGVEGVIVGVLVTTAKGGGTRVSMRGRPELIDVGAVALALGGGGHPGAAGCWLPEELPAAKARVISALEAALGP